MRPEVTRIARTATVAAIILGAAFLAPEVLADAR